MCVDVLSARWLGSAVSGMAIMDINIPTGHSVDNTDELKSQSSTVKRIDSDESKIVFYLDEVGGTIDVSSVIHTPILIWMNRVSSSSF